MAQRKSTPSGKSASGQRTNATQKSTRPGSKVADAKVSTTKAPASQAPAETGTDTAKSPSGKSPSGTSGTTSSTPPVKATPPVKSTPPVKATAAKAAGAKAIPAKARQAGKGGTRPGGPKGPAQRPPARKKKKSIVNQKQTPWGLIIATIAVVVFAAAVVGVVIATHKSGPAYAAVTVGGQSVKPSDPYRQAELPAAAAIKGVSYTVEAQHTHIEGHIKYDSSPPVGGDHSQYWADCTGTVYPKPIANENAVHMLEHGAVWITYNASKLPASQLAILKKDVSGVDRMALSPYPNLKTPISLQSWGYQLFVQKATDPRVAQFIAALKFNQKTTPEPNATCSQPTFKNHPSTFGHPLWVPANGSSGNVGGV